MQAMAGYSSDDVVWLFLIAFSPFLGSFLATVAVREAKGIGWVFGRSRCPVCSAQLGAAELVPLVSWARSRGRCRHCGTKIALLYPTIELVLPAMVIWATLATDDVFIRLWSLLLASVIVVLSLVDLFSYRLPNAWTLALGAGGLIAIGTIDPSLIWTHAVAALLGYGFMRLAAIAYRRFRGRTGLGEGDAKLFAAAGLWIGPYGLPSVLLFAALSALSVFLARRFARQKRPAREREERIAFGPFLAAGLWIVWLHGPLALSLP